MSNDNQSAKIDWRWMQFADLTSFELDQLYQLRQAVFVVEQDCPYQDADGKDHQAIHLRGFIGDQLVASLRLFPQFAEYNNHLSIGRVCTASRHRGRGIGYELMRQGIDYATRHYPAQKIQIGAQAYLKRFYSELGFKQISDEYLEDNIPHILMLREAEAPSTANKINRN